MAISGKLHSKLSGAIGNGPATELTTILNNAGADDSWNGTSVTATGAIQGNTVAGTTSVTSLTIQTSAAGLPRTSLTETAGVVATQSFVADASNSMSIAALVSGAITVSATTQTGKYTWTVTDNLADALTLKIASGNTFFTVCSTNNSAGAAGEYISLGGTATGVIWRRVESIPDATLTEAVGVYDSGKVYVQLDADEAVTFQLPATQNGLIYTFVCGNAGGEINISPAAADKITGKGIAGADDQDIKNTNGSNAVGDCITLIGDGADGWLVINMLGTWATV